MDARLTPSALALNRPRTRWKAAGEAIFCYGEESVHC